MPRDKKIKTVTIAVDREDDLRDFVADADEAAYSRAAWFLRRGTRVVLVTLPDDTVKTVLLA